MTNKLALLVAVVLGILSIVGIKAYVENLRKQHNIKLMPIEIPVAARELPEGHAINVDEDVTMRSFPRQAIEEALGETYIKDLSTIRGSRTATKVEAGRVLLEYHFRGGGGEGGPAFEGKFPREYRAMTIPVSNVTGVGGHLRPGDAIDLFVSLTFKDKERKETLDVTRALFHNVLVLATGEITNPYDPMAGKGGYQTLTLRLEPQQCSQALYCIAQGGDFHAVYAQPNTPIPEGFQTTISNSLYNDIDPEIQRVLRGGR